MMEEALICLIDRLGAPMTQVTEKSLIWKILNLDEDHYMTFVRESSQNAIS